jgi:hypothetical protein
MRATTRGFTLVEMSIILVIVGLLVGGVMVGKTLIRSAALRGVASEYQRFNTAMQNFREQYSSLPGDLANATHYWGVATTCPGDSTHTSLTGTCNGNGNDQVESSAPNSVETLRFWQHLVYAGQIEGSYSGTSGGAANTYTTTIGVNTPSSKIDGAGWSIWTAGYYDYTSTALFEGNYVNTFFYGAQVTDNITQGAVLAPKDAKTIDTKMDDGMPATGNIRVREDQTACHTGGTSATTSISTSATYDVSQNGANCSLMFLTQP